MSKRLCTIAVVVISDVAVFMGLLLLGVKLPSYLIPCIFYLQVSACVICKFL